MGQFTTHVELDYLYQVRSPASVDAASSQPVVELSNDFRLNVMFKLDFTK